MTVTQKQLKIAVKALESYAKESNWKEIEEASYTHGANFHAWCGKLYLG